MSRHRVWPESPPGAAPGLTAQWIRDQGLETVDEGLPESGIPFSSYWPCDLIFTFTDPASVFSAIK